MILIKNTLLLILCIVILASCNSSSEDMTGMPPPTVPIDPVQIIISDVSITRIFPYRLRQDPWDDDGSGPDLHVKLFLNNRNLYSSDTINNVIATDTTLDLILAEEIVLEKSDTNFYVSIYDIDPPDSGIPPIFFFDELFARYRRRNIWRTLAPYEQTTAMFLMSNRAWLSYNIRYIE